MGPANPAAAQKGAGTPAWVSAAASWSAPASPPLTALHPRSLASTQSGPGRPNHVVHSLSGCSYLGRSCGHLRPPEEAPAAI